MTSDERRAFANLVLLCTPCHKLVDGTRRQDYPTRVLEGWKADREAGAIASQAAVGGIDENDLGKLLCQGIRAALGNAELAVGETAGVVTLTAPGQVPRLLPLEPALVPAPASAPPSELVRARAGVVPFSDYRGLGGSLLDWCVDGTAFSARLVGGGPGAGKTRLAVQLCQEVGRFAWVSGLLIDRDDARELEALVTAPTPRLVVIDYAETRAAQLKVLLPRLAALATTQHPVRVLLLVRAPARPAWPCSCARRWAASPG